MRHFDEEAWNAVARKIARSSFEQWRNVTSGTPMRFVVGRAPIRRVILCTKDLAWLWAENRIPDGLALFVRGGRIPATHVQLVRSYASALGTHVLFVGDLDPSDLATFVAIQRDLPKQRGGARVDYLGVRDDWLSVLDPFLPKVAGATAWRSRFIRSILGAPPNAP